MRTRRVLSLALAVAALVGVQAAHAASHLRNGRVAFMDWRSGTFQIFTVAPNGNDPRQITHSDVLESRFPRWSPEGKRLLVARAGSDFVFNIMEMDADGGHQRWLTQGGDSYESFDWSPDGKRVVAVRMVNPNIDTACDCNKAPTDDIVVIDGQGNQKVLYQSAEDLNSVSWGANNVIAFGQGEYGYVGETNSDISDDLIMTIHADGSGMKPVGVGTTPRISRDGSHILYTADGTEVPGVGTDVREMTVTGTNDRRLFTAGWTAGLPAYAPDGKSVLVMMSDHAADSYRIERHDLRTGRFLGYVSSPGGNAGAPDEQPLT